MIVIAILGYLLGQMQLRCDHNGCPPCCGSELYFVEIVAVLIDLIILLRIICLLLKKLSKKTI